MKKFLLVMLLAGFAFGATAQNGKAIKQRKTQKEIIEHVMQTKDYMPENQAYKQQADSIVSSDEWSLNCYKYEMDWKGRVHSETLYQKFDEYTGLEPVEKRIYNYEISEACPNLDGYYWQNGEWTEGWKEVYTFDEHGDAVVWQQWDKQDMDSIWWNVTYCDTMTYDNNHNLVTSISYMYDMWTMTGYFTESKEVFEYDENNFVTASESYYTDWETNEWVISTRIEYVRMENGDYSEYTSYNYYTGDKVAESKEVKDFNEMGAIKVYHYFNLIDDSLVEAQRLTATFNESGEVITEYICEDYWTYNALFPYFKVVYEYDEMGNRTVVNNIMWNDSLINWDEPTVYTWEYDNTVAAEEVLGHQYIWNRFGSSIMSSSLEEEVPVYNRWNKYSYTDEWGTTAVEAFYINWNSIPENDAELESLNVRGLQGMIRYEGETPANIGVFDMAGRCVATRQNVVNCDINLNAGAYVVRVGNNATKVIVR